MASWHGEVSLKRLNLLCEVERVRYDDSTRIEHGASVAYIQLEVDCTPSLSNAFFESGSDFWGWKDEGEKGIWTRMK